MQTALNIAIALALLFVVVVLGMGLWNMLKGGPGNTSQKLMRLRVIGQAVALVLLMGALFFFGSGGRG
ncbi:twin transmembrane helix small protein [Devosia sp. SL43]|uniref:twin transmembrane helix small protein n=1 Tax=Devosia sp. SL43 TaxID=2806348 RepID=UPI001F255A6D|nr:twin transmembrane helix small protein [Devosia sp. SL43]UJW84018.1 twin transmembrane helix small protein [Devosia sp. SL43]